MRTTKKELLETISQNSENYRAEYKLLKDRYDREIFKLKLDSENRHTQAVGQILQSMAQMMEAASKTVLSLHRNL